MRFNFSPDRATPGTQYSTGPVAPVPSLRRSSAAARETDRSTKRPCSKDDAPRACLRHRSGFTLLELVLVLIILALTIGAVLPRIGAGWKRMEDREFLQEFVQTLRRARLRAMNSGEMTAFRINGSERLFDLKYPPEKPIPENVDIYADGLEEDAETGERLVIFYPDGSLLGNDMEIVFDQKRAFRISINPLFGSVQWSKTQPR